MNRKSFFATLLAAPVALVTGCRQPPLRPAMRLKVQKYLADILMAETPRQLTPLRRDQYAAILHKATKIARQVKWSDSMLQVVSLDT